MTVDDKLSLAYLYVVASGTVPNWLRRDEAVRNRLAEVVNNLVTEDIRKAFGSV